MVVSLPIVLEAPPYLRIFTKKLRDPFPRNKWGVLVKSHRHNTCAPSFIPWPRNRIGHNVTAFVWFYFDKFTWIWIWYIAYFVYIHNMKIINIVLSFSITLMIATCQSWSQSHWFSINYLFFKFRPVGFGCLYLLLNYQNSD